MIRGNNTRIFALKRPTYSRTTDAAITGWGAVFEGMEEVVEEVVRLEEWSGIWNLKYSNQREVAAVLIGLRSMRIYFPKGIAIIVCRSARTCSKASIGCAGELFCFGGFLLVTIRFFCVKNRFATCHVTSVRPRAPVQLFTTFGGTSSGEIIVNSGSSRSISKIRRNAFTNVGYGCAVTSSAFCGIKLAQYSV
ncbi:MAG: hypothetical protein EZS28_008686 [Streblomastix strix]|uniref:Uncharacterized protein n=1 Tax=Streblomastix strix TaxID=222440 RepID=A0A5J4WLP4_9EUKA|nr:MAG: hypothetical protein EZS28_008686 [Streblomastix strix]